MTESGTASRAKRGLDAGALGAVVAQPLSDPPPDTANTKTIRRIRILDIPSDPGSGLTSHSARFDWTRSPASSWPEVERDSSPSPRVMLGFGGARKTPHP